MSVSTFASSRALALAACKHLANTSDSEKPRSGPRILTLARISFVIAASVTGFALKSGQSKVQARGVPGGAPFLQRYMTRRTIAQTRQSKRELL